MLLCLIILYNFCNLSQAQELELIGSSLSQWDAIFRSHLWPMAKIRVVLSALLFSYSHSYIFIFSFAEFFLSSFQSIVPLFATFLKNAWGVFKSLLNLMRKWYDFLHLLHLIWNSFWREQKKKSEKISWEFQLTSVWKNSAEGGPS